MNKRVKIVLSIVFVSAIFATIFLQNESPNTTKGQIKLFKPKNNQNTDSAVLADLTLEGSLKMLSSPQNAIKVDVRIINNGPGQISGEIPFKYSIMANDKEVFSNTDSYSVMSSGDSFDFSYSILGSIHQYPQSGEILIKVDSENSIEEQDENNNEIRLNYPNTPQN